MGAHGTLQEPALPRTGGRSLAVMLGEAGVSSAEHRTHDCASPIRLRGSKELVDTRTGEVLVLYSSESELDGARFQGRLVAETAAKLAA